MSWRHAYIYNRNVWLRRFDQLKQSFGVTGLVYDVVAALTQQRSEALPEQQIVLRNDHSLAATPLPHVSVVYAARGWFGNPGQHNSCLDSSGRADAQVLAFRSVRP